MPVKKAATKKEQKKEVKKAPKKASLSEPRSPRLRESEAGQEREAEVKVAPAPEEIVRSEPDRSAVKEKYYETVGRRKESIVRIRLFTKKATDVVEEEKALITVNGKSYQEYFSDANLWNIVELPLKKLKSVNRFKVSALVHGGGKSGQADAIKHGIARALVKFDNNFRKKLKKSGYLTRDPRAKERRKYGLKKARKAPRWAKR